MIFSRPLTIGLITSIPVMIGCDNKSKALLAYCFLFGPLFIQDINEKIKPRYRKYSDVCVEVINILFVYGAFISFRNLQMIEDNVIYDLAKTISSWISMFQIASLTSYFGLCGIAYLIKLKLRNLISIDFYRKWDRMIETILYRGQQRQNSTERINQTFPLRCASIINDTNIREYSIPTECSICLQEFNSNELFRTLTCGHSFHQHCIDNWLTTNWRCALCNQNL
jgi:hypothetical protein